MWNHENMDLILASGSPRRAELLRQIGLNFRIIPSSYEETNLSTADPARLVMDLALGKAKQVARDIPSGLIIAADTIVFLEGHILGKPSGMDEAVRMLSRLSNKAHQVYTGVALIETPGCKVKVDHEITEVKFRPLLSSEIEAYVLTKEPLDKAGAYGIQGKGAVLVEGIHGCYFNVVGLPIAKLALMLQEFGVSVW